MGFPYVNDVLIRPILLETAMRWHIFVPQIKSCKKNNVKTCIANVSIKPV